MKVNRGFSLIELIIALTISSILLILVVSVYDANHRLYLANKTLSEVFYDGQFIVPLLNSSMDSVGYNNVYVTELNDQIDINSEAEFISKNPIATTSTFNSFPLIKSIEGNDKPDQIVLNTLGEKTCTGTNFDFNDGELFHVVNQYYLDGTTLRCKSYDGRYLRGLKSNTTSNYSVSLLENVQDMQIQYAIKLTCLGVNELQTFSWINADELSNIANLTSDEFDLVAVNIVILLGSNSVTSLSKQTQIRLLGKDIYVVPKNLLVRRFETIIVLNG